MTQAPRRSNKSKSRAAAQSMADTATLFAALGDEARLQIVKRLSTEGPLSIVRLTEGSNISRQAITKHLNSLSAAQLIDGNRDGRECVWQLRTERLSEVKKYLDQISAQWDQAIDRLRRFVESSRH